MGPNYLTKLKDVSDSAFPRHLATWVLSILTLLNDRLPRNALLAKVAGKAR